MSTCSVAPAESWSRTGAAKRALDLAAASFALAILAPVLAVVAAVVYLKMGRPILFRQPRAGKGGRPFTILKFRTMREAGVDDADRLTKLGRFLRRTSLDELPQLWNVLRGEMSLVGPRPLLLEYLPLYTAAQARRHEVAPGLTGWAQVRGRNATTWDRRLEDDVWYVDHRSLPLDVRILLLTILRVVDGRGETDGGATMSRFRGAAEEGR